MSDAVRVRFAPSPTGNLHIGGARTALFNWAFARRQGGVFILRIEDTDRSRSTDESIASILDAMAWLGLDWDEGPPTPGYRQTERLESYHAHAERLVAEGRAYQVPVHPGNARGPAPRGSGPRRDLPLPRDMPARRGPGGEPAALRLRIPSTGATVVRDAIHGDVRFDHAQLDDWVVVRTDGTPTYNFCAVVDDATMKITHVIRGNDHLSNTPKQILCYEALGYPLPVFAHVPMILGADKSRLSKRHGAASVQAFREAGILPEALVNYLARLGWAHGDREVWSREDLAGTFDLSGIGAASAVFDPPKLEWLSQYWMKQAPAARLAGLLPPFLERAGLPTRTDPAWLARVVETLKERAPTLVDMAEQAAFYLRPPTVYDPQATAKFWSDEAPRRYQVLLRRLEAHPDMDPASLEALYRGLAAELGLRLVDLAQLTRIALTGKSASPPLFEVMALIGRDETLARLRRALAAATDAQAGQDT